MKILLLSNLFPPDYDGGYELAAERLALALRGRGHEVSVVTSRYRRGFQGPADGREWVHRILDRRFLPPPSWPDPWRRLQAWWGLVYIESVAWRNVPRITKFLNGNSFDLAYVFGLQGVGLSTACALQEAGVPALWHFGDHSVADQLRKYSLSIPYRLIGKTLLRSVKLKEGRIRFEHCAYLSRFLKGYYVDMGFHATHSYILPRGVEFELGSDVERQRSSPPTLLMASRVVPDKGHDVVLEACRQLADRRPDLQWRLQIAGCGEEPYERRLKSLAGEEPLRGRVDFLGKVSRKEVVELMRNASAFVSASVWGEPFGNTNIEALASGTPLIISETGAALEIVTGGRSALTYPKHSPEALSQALEAILADRDLALRIAEGGVARVREAYQFDVILDQTEAIMASIAGQSEQSPAKAPIHAA